MVNRNLVNSNHLCAVMLLICITALVMTVNAANITEVKILSASDKGDGDCFGSSVTISGDVAVVAAPFAKSGGIDRGQAYVFSKDQGSQTTGGR